ncbi:MAG: hypothetical protein IJK06_01105 [Clostridia bacterium]|nr:hypothetical protein [Clostridia bacterium]
MLSRQGCFAPLRGFVLDSSSRLWGTANKGWMKKSLLTAGLPTSQFASVTCDAG